MGYLEAYCLFFKYLEIFHISLSLRNMYRMPNTVPKQIRHVIMVAAPNILQLISCILKSSNSGSEPVSLIKFILAILCK